MATIVLAVINTLAAFGRQKETGRIFRHALVYTLLTTVTAAAVGMSQIETDFWFRRQEVLLYLIYFYQNAL